MRSRLHWARVFRILCLHPWFTLAGAIATLYWPWMSLVGLLLLVPGYVRWRFETLGADGAIFFHRSGVLTTEEVKIPLKRIESVEVVTSLLGKLLGFGTLLVFGVGQQQITVDFVKDPIRLQEELLILAAAQP